VPLEELHGLWGNDNPCLLLVKRLAPGVEVLPVRGLPEIRVGDDLGALISTCSELRSGDVLVVTQKVVSKAEGRVVRLGDVEPSSRARELSGDRDPRQTEVILGEATRVVRSRPPLLIAETRHGFVCASAGVDASNAPELGSVVLLPLDPDASARALRLRLEELTGRRVAVVVTDSFGRAWRQGTTDVAIGVAGLEPLRNLHGERDPVGYELHATTIATADEIAGAAELVMGKLTRTPAAIVRGLQPSGDGTGRDLVMPPERDLFR
jgi:coenzyme F420-0:L-glutamate ligase/coenzyme F420-1:gamma-L-glutamate ligase